LARNPIIDQRVAIVTGASRGIGRAVAERLAADGRLVVLVSRSPEQLEQVRDGIAGAGGQAEALPCDVGDAEALSGVIEQVASTHGRLDILVNNAGMTRGP
jgi:3-oxoacyl-[acyl-carrier protein] reductase